MLFKSQLVTQVSGSVGGTTYSHNKSGMYQRARAIPVNPNSGHQITVRASLTSLVTAWANTLTEAQREGWNMWAANTPFINRLGDAFNISGQNAFIGANTPRLQTISKLSTAIAQVNDAPTLYNRGDFTTPSFTAVELDTLDITFNNGDDWANEDGAAMLIYMGRPQNASRNFFKGPLRLLAAIEGDSVTAPTSPVSVTYAECASRAYPLDGGTKIWIIAVVTRADGRYSSKRFVGPQTVTTL